MLMPQHAILSLVMPASRHISPSIAFNSSATVSNDVPLTVTSSRYTACLVAISTSVTLLTFGMASTHRQYAASAHISSSVLGLPATPACATECSDISPMRFNTLTMRVMLVGLSPVRFASDAREVGPSRLTRSNTSFKL